MPPTPAAGGPRRARRRTSRPPGRGLERDLIAAGHHLVAGMDEVGRGALAGPVSVGVVVVGADTGRIPAGLRDSKLLAPQVRQRLCAPIRRWCRASAVGHATAAEIDTWGVVAALRLAGHRALATLHEHGILPGVVILDGHHDWLTPPPGMPVPTPVPPVRTQVKGDLRCASIAAASVIAKCERDDHMVALHAEHPQFGWAANKGYAAAEHLRALTEHGPSRWHRRSWALPGTGVRAEQGMMDL